MRAQLSSVIRRVATGRQIDWAKRQITRPFAGNLDRLSVIYGTDKGSILHHYTDIYASYLDSRRRSVKRVLEVGIGGSDTPTLGGNSLRMWRTYFPNAQIIGVDLYPKQIDEPRITVEVCDQADVEALARLGERHGPFDMIVDDGGHFGRLTSNTFRTLFPFVVTGGLFVIEDAFTSYMPDFEGGPPGKPGSAVDLAKRLLDELHLPDEVMENAERFAVEAAPVERYHSLSAEVDRVDVYRGLIVVTRGAKARDEHLER